MCVIRRRFGENLRAIRKARGFSQEHLAHAAGIDRSYFVNAGLKVTHLLAISPVEN